MRQNRNIFIRKLLKTHVTVILSCLSLILCPLSIEAGEGVLRAHFLAVGYGDAILLDLPDGGVVLVDAGSAVSVGRVEDYLSVLGIPSLQAVILTHPHENHFGGLSGLIGAWPVGQLYTNGDDDHAEEGYDGVISSVGELGIPVTVLKEGDELTLGGGAVRCSILHPSDLDGAANENALVLWIVFKETSILLTSDIQVPQQEKLIARYPQVKSADVVQIPHHGGRISDKFAEGFGDDTVFIVSTGENAYGKPLVEELEKLKGKVLRTDLQGTIIIESAGGRVEVVHE